MYANESKGQLFPPCGTEDHITDPTATGWVANAAGETTYPEYLTDMHIYFSPSDATSDPEQFLNCPGSDWCNGDQLDPRGFDDRSYMYYGWTTENVEDLHHVPGGANVLYMDGHVKFVRYPEEFSCVEIVAALGRAIGQ